MRALIIKPGEEKLSEVNLKDSQHLHELIGNWYTTCFTVPTKRGPVIAYCDDEGLLSHSPNYRKWSAYIGHTLRTDAPYPIAGPIVISAANHEGETRELTDDEVALFKLHKFAPVFRTVPELPVINVKER